MSWIQRNALSVTLLLVALAIGLCVYTVAHNQDERAASILRSCQDTNHRHDKTLDTLTAIYVRSFHLPPHTTTAQLQHLLTKLPLRARASYEPTVLLIDNLAPHQDCSQVVSKST